MGEKKQRWYILVNECQKTVCITMMLQAVSVRDRPMLNEEGIVDQFLFKKGEEGDRRKWNVRRMCDECGFYVMVTPIRGASWSSKILQIR